MTLIALLAMLLAIEHPAVFIVGVVIAFVGMIGLANEEVGCLGIVFFVVGVVIVCVS